MSRLEQLTLVGRNTSSRDDWFKASFVHSKNVESPSVLKAHYMNWNGSADHFNVATETTIAKGLLFSVFLSFFIFSKQGKGYYGIITMYIIG
jgi:hypothetical protein